MSISLLQVTSSGTTPKKPRAGGVSAQTATCIPAQQSQASAPLFIAPMRRIINTSTMRMRLSVKTLTAIRQTTNIAVPVKACVSHINVLSPLSTRRMHETLLARTRRASWQMKQIPRHVAKGQPPATASYVRNLDRSPIEPLHHTSVARVWNALMKICMHVVSRMESAAALNAQLGTFTGTMPKTSGVQTKVATIQPSIFVAPRKMRAPLISAQKTRCFRKICQRIFIAEVSHALMQISMFVVTRGKSVRCILVLGIIRTRTITCL